MTRCGAILDIQRGMKHVSCIVARGFPGRISRDLHARSAQRKISAGAEKFPRHVLVVDDEPLIRWSVAESLSDLGLDVEQAADAASALRTVTNAALPFDVVVLDLRLPDMDDLSLLGTLRQLLPGASLDPDDRLRHAGDSSPTRAPWAPRSSTNLRARRAEAPRRRPRDGRRLMPNATVLVVDDEPLIRWSLVNRLKEEGYRTLEAGTAGDAVAQHRDGVDLVLLDFALPDANGLTVLKQIKETDPDTLVIMLTANTEVGTAVEAMKAGAFHYANKPFDLDEIVLLVEKALETTQLRREVRVLRARKAQPYGLTSIVGESAPIKAVRALLEKIGVSPASTVLLTGESGTGKDLAAKVIHYSSSRASQAVHEHHVLGAARDAARERAVRPRARRLHRRRSPEARPDRIGRRRHGVPRRDRRDGAAAAGQAAALSRGEIVQARRRRAGRQGRRPRDRGDQSIARRRK